MAIDYGLNVRQAAINNLINATARKAQAEEKAKAERARADRQKRKGLMTLALHAGAAVATGGASIPYSMKYGALANQALMGSDYQGSDVQALQGLGSMVYQGAEANKMKNLAGMEKAYNGQLDSIYKAIDALPPGAKMERARLANQAANLTTTFQKNLKAAEAKPVWEFASSERERMQAKSLGEIADKGQKSYDEMYTQQSVIPQKVKEAEGTQVSQDKIKEAYSDTSRGSNVVKTPKPPPPSDFDQTQNIFQQEANRKEGLMNIPQNRAGFGRGELSDKAGGFGRYQTNLAREISQEEVDKRNALRRARNNPMMSPGIYGRI